MRTCGNAQLALMKRVMSSHIQRLTEKHIAEDIDTAAREGQKIAPVRIVVVVLAAILLGANGGERLAAIWMMFGLASEIASYWVRLTLGRSPVSPVRMRFIYLLTAASVSVAWSVMPLLYWVNGVPGFEAVSVLILTAQLVHAQAFTYRSIPLLTVVGGIPSVMLLVLPWLSDKFSSVRSVTVTIAASLAIGYVIASVVANRKTAQKLKEVQDELEQLAYFDPLTSLANRRMFIADLRILIENAARTKARLALLLVDLDRFKDINDALGHDAGDALLVEIGARLRSAVRADDKVARLGGDEFAIILKDAQDPPEFRRICKRIADSFADVVEFKGNIMVAGSSVGVAVFPEDGDQEESLYKSADVALYAAKRDGRNRWGYSAAASVEVEHRL